MEPAGTPVPGALGALNVTSSSTICEPFCVTLAQLAVMPCPASDALSASAKAFASCAKALEAERRMAAEARRRAVRSGMA